MHLHFNFDACPMHSPFGFVHLTHQNLRARALFCHNALAKVNTQLLIYNYYICCGRVYALALGAKATGVLKLLNITWKVHAYTKKHVRDVISICLYY